MILVMHRMCKRVQQNVCRFTFRFCAGKKVFQQIQPEISRNTWYPWNKKKWYIAKTNSNLTSWITCLYYSEIFKYLSADYSALEKQQFIRLIFFYFKHEFILFLAKRNNFSRLYQRSFGPERISTKCPFKLGKKTVVTRYQILTIRWLNNDLPYKLLQERGDLMADISSDSALKAREYCGVSISDLLF